MSITPGSVAWKLAYQISPIILKDGIAQSFPYKLMPIALLTEMINFPLGLLAPSFNIELDNFFANWRPVPGTSLLEQDVAKYPFATNQVAANATIVNPTTVSMLFDAPAKGPMGYIAKLPIMMVLRDKLYDHNTKGGTYIVMTPSFIFLNCLMRSFKDVSTSYAKQVQTTWQLDFEKPLVTSEEAEDRLNELFKKLDSQAPMPQPVSTSGAPVSSPVPMSSVYPKIPARPY